MAAAKKKQPVVEIDDDTPLGDYLFEVGIIADLVIAEGLSSRDREAIRSRVNAHIDAQHREAKKRDRRARPLELNRRQQVVRGLTIGVTKALEAWEWVSLNRAWPPQDEAQHQPAA